MKLTKLPKKDAASGPRGGGPSSLTVNSSYVSIRVTPYNFTPHYRTFTVDEYVDVKTHSGYHGESNNRAPQVVSQSEQPPASASDPVDAATKVMAVDQPTPPSFGVQVANATLSESWKCSKL
ncbi:hypothetical protein F2Q69_00055196 [Brassica cretica]|uniref:Uncharacterized protein n=1 Tax=Brassica cretica TaxID=69181 RepID=A0A8S9MVI6_BRACR|nr:hypothetical protein F2Q69_00055196 [Brassica cretica]